MSDLVTQPSRRLAMAITELDAGGAERAFVRIAIGLKSVGWHVRVISLRDAGPLAATLRDAGIEVTTLNCGGACDLRAITRMRADLRRDRPDVLLTFLHQANIAGRLAASLAGVTRMVCSVRVADRRKSVSVPERLTRSLVSRYVAVSPTVARVHADVCRLPADRVVVIANGVDAAAIDATPPVARSQFGCAPGDFVVLCVGRLTEQKAPGDVLDAFIQFRAENALATKSARLCFVGDGPLRSELERRVRDEQQNDHVRIVGQRADVIAIMKAANVLVLASRWEGLPNVVLEAHAAGLPVIASDVDGCRDLVNDGVTGRLFPPASVPRLASCLSEAFDDCARYRSFAAAARTLVHAEYSWDTCIARFDALLSGV